MPGITGPALQDHVDRRGPHSRLPGAAGLGQAVHGRACCRGLDSPDASESGAPAALLFLDGIEADGDGEVALVFGFARRAGRPKGAQRIAPRFPATA